MTMTDSSSPAPHSSPAPEPVWSAQSDDPSAAVFSLKFAPLILCLVVIALLCIGMAMIHSATIATKGDYFFTHQLMWIGIGLFVFLFAAFAPLRFFYRFSHWGILLIILPLAYLAFAKAMVHFGGTAILRFFPLISSIERRSGLSLSNIECSFLSESAESTSYVAYTRNANGTAEL